MEQSKEAKTAENSKKKKRKVWAEKRMYKSREFF